MPLTKIDYSKTIIYKIVCNDLNVKDTYVGHTTDFTRRKKAHKHRVKMDTKYKLYETIKENGDWNNWIMVEIEKVNCIDSLEARKRERYWIETLKANLNKIVPTRTTKEYYIDNKEVIKKQNKELTNKLKEAEVKVGNYPTYDVKGQVKYMSSRDIYYELITWAMELCLYGNDRKKVNRIEKIANKYF